MLIPLSPPPGLVRDDTSFSAQGRWADGDNVRFVEGKPQPVGGWRQIIDLSLVMARCRALFVFDRGDVTGKGLVLGFATPDTDPKLYIRDPNYTGFYTLDVTPAGLATSSYSWSLAGWGTTLLAVPNGGTLYEQTGSSTATAVGAAPDNITCMVVTQERQVLALGCNEEVSGTFNARCIRGCDLEDYTDWTTSATNNAFEHILDGSGNIVGATVLGPYVIVWTSTAMHLGTFIGDPEQTYRFDKIDDNCGLIGPKAFCILNQRVYWIGSDGQPMTWAIGELPEVVPCPVLSDFTLGLGAGANSPGSPMRIAATSISRFGEVRFYYPAGGSENGAYIAFQPSSGAWHKGSIGRSAALESALLISASYESKLIGSTDLNRIVFDESDTDGDFGVERSWSIQSADQYLDEAQRRFMIRGIIPDFKDQVGDISLTLYVRDRPQSAPVTKGPYTLVAGATKKDFRISGKIAAVKISGGDLINARLGKLEFDVVPLGER